MNTLNLVFLLISLTCFVELGNCGVINNVYGTVENGTQAIRDRVYSYWSYGKDMLFGSEIENITERTLTDNTVHTQPGQSFLGSLYSSVVDGYRLARRKLREVFIDPEDGEEGVVSSLYKRVGRKVAQVKSFFTGDDSKSIEPENNQGKISDIATLQDRLSKFLESQRAKRRRSEDKIDTDVENAGHQLTEGLNVAKNDLYDFSQDAGKRVNVDIQTTNYLVRDKVDNARHDIGASFNNLQENMNELTEKEKEILNSISIRLRSRMSNVYRGLENTGEDLKQLSYGVTRNEV